MKRFLIIILTAIFALACFACAGNNATNQENNEANGTKRPWYRSHYYLCVREINSEDKYSTYRSATEKYEQERENAILQVGIEYDMFIASICCSIAFLDDVCEYDTGAKLQDAISVDNPPRPFVFNNNYYDPYFQYDETKIEIKKNPDKEDHFVLKVLQPCNMEDLWYVIQSKTRDYMEDKNGNKVYYYIPFGQPSLHKIYISTEE